MKKIVLILLMFGLTGCLKTRSDVSEQEEQKQIQSQISEIRQSKAEQELRSQSVESELRNMYGRIEIVERRLNENQQNRFAEETEVTKQQKDLIDQMKIFEESLANMSARLEKLEKSQAKPEKSAAAATEKNKSSWDKAEDLFVKKDWKTAALSYQQYIDHNPKGANVSMALYKMGVCFQELKMKDEAKSFFEEAVAKHPNSSAARKAKYRLNQIK